MDKARWGRKLTCHNCGVKYYDLKKRIITCPKCDAPYKEGKIKTRRGATTDVPKPVPEKPKVLETENELLEVKLDDDILEAEDDKSADVTIMEDTSDIGGDDEDIEEVIGVVDDSEVKE